MFEIFVKRIELKFIRVYPNKIYTIFDVEEVIECPFYIPERRWSFNEVIEMDEDDEILEGRKYELFTFDSRYNNYTLR